MFQLNQPTIKNKVLTWSRDLTARGVTAEVKSNYFIQTWVSE